MRKLAAALASAATVAAMILNPFGPVAVAGTSVGSFEIDGNTPDSAPGEPLDWSDLATDPTAHITPFTDGTGSGDDGFIQGSKDSISSAWKCGNNGDPGKVDIKSGDIAFRTINGKQYVYVDFSRWTNNGDSHLDFEFAKSSAAASTSCTNVPKRSVGDIVITFDTGKDQATGNKTLSVQAFKFTAAGGKADTFVSLGVGSQGSQWDGAVSSDNLYGEAVLNLSDTIGTIGCGDFAGAYMKSRSSTSLTAALQDLVGKQPINPGNCPQSDLRKEVRNASPGSTDDFGPSTDAKPGDTLEYRLTYTNTGPGAANNVTISDQLSSGQTLVANSCTPPTTPCAATTTKPTWTFTSIAANGGTQVVTFRTTINSNITPLPTTISNTGVVITKEEPQGHNSNTTTVNVTGIPNLTVSDKQAYIGNKLVTTVNPGDVVTYKITVSNSGTAAGSIEFVDDYDDLLTPSAVTTTPAGGSCSPGTIGTNKVVNCDSGPVAAGTSMVFTYTATMPAKIVITDERVAGCPENNSSDYPIKNVVLVGGIETVHKTVCLHVAPILTGSKSASPTLVDAGGTVTYTLSITNSGTAPGSDSVSDNGASGRLTNVTLVQNDYSWTCSTTNSSISCTSGDIDPGQTQFVKFTAQVPSSFNSGDSQGTCSQTTGQRFAVTNTAVFPKGGTKTATVCVKADPDYSIIKRVNGSTTPITANVNETVTYTIEVKNIGKGPGRDTFPDDYADQLVNVQTPTGSKGGTCTATTTNGNKGWSCTTALLNPDDNEVFTYTAKTPPTVAGLSQGDCGTGYFQILNTISSTVHATVCVSGTPKITWKKQAFNAAGQEITNGTVSPDQVITYKITADNTAGTAQGTSSFTDDYDDLLSPTTPVGSGAGSGSCVATGKAWDCSATVPAGGIRVYTYTAAMPHQIVIADNRSPGGPDCANTTKQSYPIKNVIVVDGIVVTSKTVCVEFSADLTPNKTLDSGTPAPGATVTYAITVANNGNAPGSTTVHDSSNGGLTNVTITSAPTGWSCTVTNNVIDCTTGNIDPGQSQTLKYTATLPSTFTGTPGSPNNDPCKSENPHEYPVVNKVTLGNGKTSTKTVCVPASPQLALVKSVTRSTDAAGTEYLTYTLAYGNNGPAEATSATITETIPAGTTYSSCTGGCSPVTNGQTTWTVGPIAPNTPSAGFVTLTVAVTTDQTCSISNTAQIRFMNDTVVSSNTVRVTIVPKPHPENANASGSTTALAVTASGIIGLNVGLAGAAASSQHGVGVNSKVDNPVSVNLGTLLTANALRTTSTSRVTSSPAAARNTSSAEVAGLCLKIAIGPCLVSSDTVRAVASTVATGSSASSSTAGTTIENLQVAGAAVAGLDVNTQDTATVTVGGITTVEISVNERQDNPTPGLYGSTYKAGLTVTALHIKVKVLGLLKTEVIVSQASSYSDFPQTFVCTVGANQSVSGHAFIASAAATTALTGKLADEALGYVELPPLGGSDSQHIVGASVLGGNAASAQVADSLTEGTVNPNVSSGSHSYAEIAGDGSTPACVLKTGTTCLVTATAIRSETSTTSNAGGSVSNDTGTTFTNARVNIGTGIAIPINPDPNTVIPLPGLGFLVVNEQFCDGSVYTAHTCTGAHHSGITVRALHLVLNVLNNPSAFLAGADVIVVEAHSDGSFG